MKKMEEIGKEAETKLKGKFLVKVFTEGKKVVGKAFISKKRFKERFFIK